MIHIMSFTYSSVFKVAYTRDLYTHQYITYVQRQGWSEAHYGRYICTAMSQTNGIDSFESKCGGKFYK
jgi:hypothetical protein